jgi:hypothetical protein
LCRYAEDRLHETERQLAKAVNKAEAGAGAPPSTPGLSTGGGSAAGSFATPGSSVFQTPAGAGGDQGAAGEENKQLKSELKERKRQMHKLQEVYGRLKVGLALSTTLLLCVKTRFN